MKRSWWVPVPFVVVIILCFAYPYVLQHWHSDIASRGQIGDSYGGLNTLFSGLAFSAFIIALFLQKKDLELQREELQGTKEELKRTADIQEKNMQIMLEQMRLSAKTAKIQTLNTLIEFYTQVLEPGDPRVGSAIYKRTMREGSVESLKCCVEEVVEMMKDIERDMNLAVPGKVETAYEYSGM